MRCTPGLSAGTEFSCVGSALRNPPPQRRVVRRGNMTMNAVPEPEMVTDVAVLAALGLDHADDALGAADVCNLEPNHLARASHPGESMWMPVA